MDQVTTLLPQVLVRGDMVILPANTPPALAVSTARCAFGNEAVYTGHNRLGLPIYQRTTTTTTNHANHDGQNL